VRFGFRCVMDVEQYLREQKKEMNLEGDPSTKSLTLKLDRRSYCSVERIRDQISHLDFFQNIKSQDPQLSGVLLNMIEPKGCDEILFVM